MKAEVMGGDAANFRRVVCVRNTSRPAPKPHRHFALRVLYFFHEEKISMAHHETVFGLCGVNGNRPPSGTQHGTVLADW